MKNKNLKNKEKDEFGLNIVQTLPKSFKNNLNESKEKLSNQELNEIEIKINQTNEKRELTLEEEKDLRESLISEREIRNENLDEEIESLLNRFGEGKHRLLRDMVEENKISRDKCESRGWAIFYIIVIALVIFSSLLF